MIIDPGWPAHHWLKACAGGATMQRGRPIFRKIPGPWDALRGVEVHYPSSIHHLISVTSTKNQVVG